MKKLAWAAPLPFVVAALLGATVVGCAAHSLQAIGSASQAPTPGLSQGPSKLLMFGGPHRQTYLGCLNCSQYATDSILNRYGLHGSAYSSESIWNPYSKFASAYSTYCACSPYASEPPVIVDSEGRFYGSLTLNIFHPQRGIGEQYYEWLQNAVCNQ